MRLPLLLLFIPFLYGCSSVVFVHVPPGQTIKRAKMIPLEEAQKYAKVEESKKNRRAAVYPEPALPELEMGPDTLEASIEELMQ